MKNYIRFDRLFRIRYMYFDTKDYLADSLFTKNKVKVDFHHGEYHKEGEPYIIIECSVRKKDKAAFEKSMDELRNKMALYKHNDYDDWCAKFIALVEGNEEC